MSNIIIYQNNKPCMHCIWIADDPSSNMILKKKMTRFHTINPHQDFLGVTVFDSRNVFFNTFNCVNGVKADDYERNHDFRNIGSLLQGATLFIEYLNKKYKVKSVNLLINSNVNKKYRTKEHPHALITLLDEEEKIPSVDSSSADDITHVASEPSVDDIVVELNPKECAELIRTGKNAMNYIASKLSKLLINISYYLTKKINNKIKLKFNIFDNIVYLIFTILYLILYLIILYL